MGMLSPDFVSKFFSKVKSHAKEMIYLGVNDIYIVDARMGRGKSSAAIRYMNEHKDSKRFLYITPFLSEVDRICEACDFDQPDSDHLTKSAELKNHLRRGDNVAASHSLFYLMDDEAIALSSERGYSLIIDESIDVVSRIPTSVHDMRLIVDDLSTIDEDGHIIWRDPCYTGKFTEYKEAADTKQLYMIDGSIIEILNPGILSAFESVYILTYLFAGSVLDAYLQYFGFHCKAIGVCKDGKGFRFTDTPDAPQPIDYSGLIRIVDNSRMNSVGDPKYSLSKAWYDRRGYDHPDIKKLRKHTDNFFRHMTSGGSDKRLWTCFKSDLFKVSGSRYRKNFLQLASRATNEYAGATDIAYLVNRYADPNIIKFFAQRNIHIDPKNFALSEMLQWIWRSAIRNGEPINLYIPSRRMRTFLTEWMGDLASGGETK